MIEIIEVKIFVENLDKGDVHTRDFIENMKQWMENLDFNLWAHNPEPLLVQIWPSQNAQPKDTSKIHGLLLHSVPSLLINLR